MRSKGFAAIVTAMGLVFSLSGVAVAAPVESQRVAQFDTEVVDSPEGRITQEQLRAAFEELKESDLPRVRSTDEGQPIVIFTLPSGAELALPDFDAPQLFVSGGRSGLSGFWLEFTPREQDALISGGGFALEAAICAIPAVGQAACVIVGALITGATWAISSYGKCNTRLHVDFSWTGKVRGARCT